MTRGTTAMRDCARLSSWLLATLVPVELVTASVALAQGKVGIAILDPAPRVARVGEPLRPTLTAAVLDSGGHARPNEGAVVVMEAGNATLTGNTATTDAEGSVSFPDLRVSGRSGEFQLVVVAGGARSAPMELNLQPGFPSRLVLEVQPPPRIVPESPFTRSPRVRVEDSAGNPIGGQTVAVELCKTSDADSTDRPLECPGRGDLIGKLFHQSGEGGTGDFDSLAVSGKAGEYFLRFSVGGFPSCTVISNPMTYDPDLLNRNYVAIAAIKSLAGEIPDDEFFDIRFKFRIMKRVTVLASTDLALTSRGSTDSVRGTQSELTEAMAWTGVELHLRKNRYNDIPERAILVGPVLKVFNTFPYVGAQVGGSSHRAIVDHGLKRTTWRAAGEEHDVCLGTPLTLLCRRGSF